MPRASRSSASSTASIVRDAAEHADLDGVDAEVLGDGAHLGDDHRRRDGLDGAHRDRVLRGDRRDRRRPVHAGRREGLEVGLDAGAAAGVRAGDRQADGDCGGAPSSRAATRRTA